MTRRHVTVGDPVVGPLTIAAVESMGLIIDAIDCDIQHVRGMRPHRHIALPPAEAPLPCERAPSGSLWPMEMPWNTVDTMHCRTCRRPLRYTKLGIFEHAK